MNKNCIMPEQPYCPACEYGLIIYPEDADSIEGCDTEWACLLKDEKEKVFLMGEKMLDLLLKPCLEKGKPELIKEMDGTYTLIYDYLGLLTNQDTLQEAIEDIIDQAKEYAQDYLENIDVYQRDEERREHLPLLLAIAKANKDSDIKNMLGLNY